MAEIPRRVEPRVTIGTGFATDPERIEEIEEEAARFERTFRKPPKRPFKQVLKERIDK